MVTWRQVAMLLFPDERIDVCQGLAHVKIYTALDDLPVAFGREGLALLDDA